MSQVLSSVENAGRTFEHQETIANIRDMNPETYYHTLVQREGVRNLMTARDTQLDSELVQQIFAEAGFDLTASHRQQLLNKDAIRYTLDRYSESIFRVLTSDANLKLKGRIFAAGISDG